MDFPPRPREAPREPPPRARARRSDGAGTPTEPPGPPPREPEAPRGRRRPRRETLARIGVAVPWIALAIFIVAVGGIPFALAMIAFAVIGLSELFRMTRKYRPMVPIAFAAAAALGIAAYYGSQFQLVLVFAAAFPAMFLYVLPQRSFRVITSSM